MTQHYDLRRYPHPGKFEGGLSIDRFVYDVTSVGADDETGDVSEYGVWYCIIRGPFKLEGAFVDFVPSVYYDMTPDERAFLASIAGCIVCENDQGFVSVEYHDTVESLEDSWCACLEATSEDDETEDGVDR